MDKNNENRKSSRKFVCDGDDGRRDEGEYHHSLHSSKGVLSHPGECHLFTFFHFFSLFFTFFHFCFLSLATFYCFCYCTEALTKAFMLVLLQRCFFTNINILSKLQTSKPPNLQTSKPPNLQTFKPSSLLRQPQIN